VTWRGPHFTAAWLCTVVLLCALLVFATSVGGIPPLVLILIVVAGPLLLFVIGLAAFFGFGEAIDWLRHRSASAREAAGRCVRCNYDLRATEEKCPECGMPVWRPRDPLTRKVIDRRPSDGQ
jgi:hypothetical protein